GGTLCFRIDALSVIARLGVPVVLYVSPARIGERVFLTWGEVRTVCDAGIQIGSHGLDHRSLGRIPAREVWGQVRDSREMLEQRLGIAVTSLAYPYGTVRDFSGNVKEDVRRAGYNNTATAINGVNRRPM